MVIMFGFWNFKSERFCTLPLILFAIASNANMGGPTTAAVIAVAGEWEYFTIPAILCGTLGYAIAIFISVLIGNAINI